MKPTNNDEITSGDDIDGTNTDDPVKSPFKLLTVFTGRTIPPVPKTQQKYPEPDVSLYSRATFSWISKILSVSRVDN